MSLLPTIIWFFLLSLQSTNTQLITNWELSSNGLLSQPGLSGSCIVSTKPNNTESIYIFGGILDNNHYINSIFKWNFNTNINTEFTEIATKIPSDIICESITYDTNNNIIYMVGTSPSPSNYGTIYTFNSITDTFESSKIPSMSTHIRSSCIVIDNKNNLLYSIGGLDANETAINRLQILNIITNKWKKRVYIQSIPIHIAALSCWLSSDSSTLYTFGGKSSSAPLRDIYRYKVITNSWSLIGNLTKPKSSTKAIYINSYNKVLIIGGVTEGDVFCGDIESFDPINEGNTALDTQLMIQTSGHLMSVYIASISQIFLWGMSDNTSRPFTSNAMTLSPTKSPFIPLVLSMTFSPTLSPTVAMETILTEPNAKPEQEYVDNGQKHLLDINSTIIIGIAAFVLILCSVTVMLYIRINGRDNSLSLKRPRLETESECSDEIALNINNLCVEDFVKMVSENSNPMLAVEVQELQRENTVASRMSMDLSVQDDVNIVHVDNSSVCARRGSARSMLLGCNELEVCDELDVCDGVEMADVVHVEEEKMEQLQLPVAPVPVHTNNMANHEMAEGFDDDFDVEDRFKKVGSVGSSNFEIDNVGVMSVISVSEVQLEGLAIMRRQRNKSRYKKHNKYKHFRQNDQMHGI